MEVHKCGPQTLEAQPVGGGARLGFPDASPSEHPLPVFHRTLSLVSLQDSLEVRNMAWHAASGGPLCETQHVTG